MSATRPPLLTPDQRAWAQDVGRAIRSGQVTALVGAGLSVDSLLPSWRALAERLILALREVDASSATSLLSSDEYSALVGRTSDGDDLATVGFVRSAIAGAIRLREGKTTPRSFAALVSAALYADPWDRSGLFAPEPGDVHRHFVALFANRPRRIWTTNYDDLSEVAARRLDIPVTPVDAQQHIASADLQIARLHGYPLPG